MSAEMPWGTLRGEGVANGQNSPNCDPRTFWAYFQLNLCLQFNVILIYYLYFASKFTAGASEAPQFFMRNKKREIR